MDKRATPIDTEMQAVAMIARGDTYEMIRQATGLKKETIAKIKKRNATQLAAINEKVIERATTQAAQILTKTQRIVNTKLDWAEQDMIAKREAATQLRADEIDEAEYHKATDHLTDVSLRDLSAISKDFWTQTQVEAGKPTAISGSDSQTAAELRKVVDALEKGDEVALERIVFNEKPHVITQ